MFIPILFITWNWDDNKNGWGYIVSGLKDLFGIDD
jgi:hypothetical protein